jgi:hypothetical protein
MVVILAHETKEENKFVSIRVLNEMKWDAFRQECMEQLKIVLKFNEVCVPH